MFWGNLDFFIELMELIVSDILIGGFHHVVVKHAIVNLCVEKVMIGKWVEFSTNHKTHFCLETLD